jgi:hypothetical protein
MEPDADTYTCRRSLTTIALAPQSILRHKEYIKGVRVGELLTELWAFMKERKKFWLLPVLVVLLLFGTLIVLTQGSAVAPFIYTLF